LVEDAAGQLGISQLRNLEKVPIPVDIHIARASLTTGVVRGKYQGRLEDLFERIREAWFQSVQGLMVKERPMIALDVDEPLWHLSKYGCRNRHKLTGHCSVHQECEARDFCITGKVNTESSLVELDT
jgi:endonuclease III